MISAPLTTAASVIISGFAVPALTQTGLRKLHEKPYPATVIALLGVLGAGLGATAAAMASTTETLAALPGLLTWVCTLSAAAACDARTRRMPTALLRLATLATIGLLVMASVVMKDPSPERLIRGVLTAAVCGGLLWLGWKLGSLGRADARLATLGGFGLGWLELGGLWAGVVVFALVSGLQVVVILVRGGGRKTQLPYGPALAAGFIAAALAAI